MLLLNLLLLCFVHFFTLSLCLFFLFAFTLSFYFLDLHLLALFHSVLLYLGINDTALHKRLAIVLRGKVCCGDIKPIIVVCRD